MKINRISLKNIRSYKNQEIEFPAGSILLSGDIGSGKTTVLLAIEFALFGLQPGQRGSSLLSNGESEGSVSLEMEIDGANMTIQRTLKRSTKSVSQEAAQITIEGLKSEMSVTELKTRVLNVLGYPEEFIKKTNLLYRYTVYSPQEEMKQIILEDSETRLDMLRHIFGIDKYRRIKDNLDIYTLHLREEARALQPEIRNIEEVKSKILESHSAIARMKSSISSAESLVIATRATRKGTESELQELKLKQVEKQRFEKEIEKANLLLSNKIQNLSEQEKEVRKLSDKISLAKDDFKEQDYIAVSDAIQRKKIELELCQKAMIEFAAKSKSLVFKKNEDMEKKNRIFKMDFCPTCLQDVSENHKHNIINETEGQLAHSDKELAELKLALDDSEKAIAVLKKEISSLELAMRKMEISKALLHEIESSRKRLEELSRARDATSKDISVLNGHLLDLKSSLLEHSKFDNLVRLKEDELKKAFTTEKKAEIELAEFKKELQFLERGNLSLKEELSRKESIRAKFIRLNELEKWLSEELSRLITSIERNILLRVRGEFTRLFNKWFSMLTTEAFSVQLDENFTPVIRQSDYELDYSYLSGGERTAVALAYRLALNQILNSIHSRIKTRNLLILDEPTDGFSEQQLDKVRDILRELSITQLIIVSHEQKIESFVDTVIKIKKDSSGSTKE